MKIKSFRIQNFRSIVDTGTENIENITVFIGENESGKTTILKAIEKFNQDSKGDYDDDYDVVLNSNVEEPEDQYHPFITITFNIEEEMKDIKIQWNEYISTINPEVNDLEGVAALKKIKKVPFPTKEVMISKYTDNCYLIHNIEQEYSDECWKILKEYIPVIVYFDETHMIDDFIDLDTFEKSKNDYQNMYEFNLYLVDFLDMIDSRNNTDIKLLLRIQFRLSELKLQ